MLHLSSQKKLNREDPRFLSSVHRGMAVIECLAGALGPRSLTELSQETGLTIPTLQRLTATLMEAGYLERAGTSKRYKLTVRTLDLLYFYLSRSTFAKSAWPHMVRLRDRVQLDVSLALPLDQSMIYLHRLPGSQGSFESTLPGRLSSLAHSASGHCLLAPCPDAQIKTYLEHAMAAQPEKTADVLEQIMACRAQGYSLMAEPGPLGLISLACAVTQDGQVRASVSVHAQPTAKAQDDMVTHALPALGAAASSLSN